MSQTSPRLSGRLYVVTGATRGLGRAIALGLAAEGARLVLLGRTVGGLEELDDQQKALSGQSATLVPLDLQEHNALDALGASLYERFGAVDGLVGAAGTLGQLSPIGHIPPRVWQEVLDVNLTANYRLIRSLDPLLRRSTAGRALFVTDRAGRDIAYWNPYSGSKAALETLVLSYAGETRKTDLRVNLFSPPPFASRLRTRSFPGEDPASLPTAEQIARSALPLLLPDCQAHGQVFSV